MTGAADPDSRYTVLPREVRLERRAGATIGDIQIARAHAYVARLEAELAPGAPDLAAPARQRKHRALDQWRAHLIALHADVETAATSHAAE